MPVRRPDETRPTRLRLATAAAAALASGLAAARPAGTRRADPRARQAELDGARDITLHPAPRGTGKVDSSTRTIDLNQSFWMPAISPEA
jgi:hypothetical protein